MYIRLNIPTEQAYRKKQINEEQVFERTVFLTGSQMDRWTPMGAGAPTVPVLYQQGLQGRHYLSRQSPDKDVSY